MSRDSKHVVITGCTRGLGRALTEFFIESGHCVTGCGRSKDEIAALAKKHPQPHAFSAVDVADDESVAHWARKILAASGPPDYLINNAAVIAPNAPLWKVSDEDFARVLDVNVKGTASVIRHFVPAMISRGGGVIVNFSSGWGRSTSPEVASYCASKWAIEGLTQALARELPEGMAAVAFNPGIIDTAMLRSCFGAEARSYPKPEQWARTAGPFILRLNARDNGKAVTAP